MPRLRRPDAAMSENAVMIPSTVPNNPMYGVIDAVVARNEHAMFRDARLPSSCAEQCAVHSLETLRALDERAGRPACFQRRGHAVALQFRVAGLKQADERTCGKRRTALFTSENRLLLRNVSRNLTVSAAARRNCRCL